MCGERSVGPVVRQAANVCYARRCGRFVYGICTVVGWRRPSECGLANLSQRSFTMAPAEACLPGPCLPTMYIVPVPWPSVVTAFTMALAAAIEAWTAIGLSERHETLDQHVR